ncbi:MAG: GIY-YIG nuclease family protein [Nostoc sp.]|uniref:GIY-YIG nuclease family protein n=1 Tax=Nostoc sp. TaxID=1180 RepID=UPI002FFAE650
MELSGKIPSIPCCYMIELSRPLGNEKHQARYYLGSCANLKKRFQQHLQGSGAAFTRAAIKRGIFDRLKTKKTYLTKFMNIDDSIINF